MVAAASLLTILLLALAIAIAAKPVLEPKSPLKFPLVKRRSLANYNVMERDQRRVTSLRRRAGNQDDDSESDLRGSINTAALYEVYIYTLRIGMGDPPQFCE